MPPVSNNSILEFVVPSTSSSSNGQDKLTVDTDFGTVSAQEDSTNLESLTIFGTKPNAIVRPLQRETPAIEDGDGLSDGFAKRIKQIEDDKGFLEKLARKRHQFNKTNRDLLPREPVKTNNFKDEMLQKPLFITTVPRGVFLPPSQPLPPIPKKTIAFLSHPNVSINQRLSTKTYDKNGGLYASHDSHLSRKPVNEPPVIARKVNSVETLSQAHQKGSNGNIPNITGLKLPALRQNHRENFQSPPQPQGRLIKGSNFSHPPWDPYFAYAGLLSGKAEVENVPKKNEVKFQEMLKKRQKEMKTRKNISPTLKNRRLESLHSGKYLEELYDRPRGFEGNTQTDLFLQRPPTPRYVPNKIGVDAETEIQEGELIDYEFELDMTLETMIRRTLEQAMVEVTHEEELADLKEQQERLRVIRQREEETIKKLEEENRRRSIEVAKRLSSSKPTAAQLLQDHISDLLPAILEELEPLKDVENRSELEEQLRPWLAQEVAEEIGQMIDSRDLLEEIVKQVLRHRAELYTNKRLSKQASREEDVQQ